MKLAALLIKNFKCIGSAGCQVRIDKIVVLVGPNNAGKSTILDAYEAFASSGKEQVAESFHKGSQGEPIEITGVFNELTSDDLETVGAKWMHEDPSFGTCIKAQWVWPNPGERGKKRSFDPAVGDFVDGGLGGWDSLLRSRIPEPVRIRPTDSLDITQSKIVDMLKGHVKQRLKDDAAIKSGALAQLEALTAQIYDESRSVIDEASRKISEAVSEVFPSAEIALVPRAKGDIDEKLIGAESFLSVSVGGSASALALQGTGIQRALLWSTLAVMADSSSAKKKGKDPDSLSRILLIDEPEAFLHPPAVRSAREFLYAFALNNDSWQVIATTHSPIFIDLAKDHTTIVRVDPRSTELRYFSTDRASFSSDEKVRLNMVRAANPLVNEFFFHDSIFLVEGPTEQVALNHFAAGLGKAIHVINCLGKANIPMFARILNQFRVPYVVIHDSDAPKVRRKSGYAANAMWTLNGAIWDAVSECGLGRVYVQIPNFERHFFSEDLVSGKVDNITSVLASAVSPEYKEVEAAYRRVLELEGECFLSGRPDFDSRVRAFRSTSGLEGDPLWDFAS